MTRNRQPASLTMRAFPLLLIYTATLFPQTYTIQKSNTTENLRGLSAPSANIIWASGPHGTYLRSTDGGNTWHSSQVPGAEALDFRDVEAFSADFAYLLSAGPGDQSRIYKTADGGKSWTRQFTNADSKGFFDCMAFWDRDHGIAVGDPVNGSFELITTNDGGKNWTPVPASALPSAIAGEGAFAASGSCITVAGSTDVLVRHWRQGRPRISLHGRRKNLESGRHSSRARRRFVGCFLHRFSGCKPWRDRRRRLQTTGKRWS